MTRTDANMLLQERPAIASFHFGLPHAGWLRELRAAGIVATTIEEAAQIEAGGLI